MFDLIVKGGTLPDGRVADIGIRGDRITAIETLDAEAGEIIDASGDLVSPPFVDPHFHMDATLSYGKPRINASGTLLEGIGLWGELKGVMTQEEVVFRALKYCDWAASMGLLAIRSHVDTCDDRLLGVEASQHRAEEQLVHDDDQPASVADAVAAPPCSARSCTIAASKSSRFSKAW